MTVDPGEGCDDGNTTNGDGCSATCAVEAANPVCGNGIREVGEACDDHNTTSGDGCSSTCTVESVCGNGVLEAGETCDDHNTMSGDGCSSTCQQESSGACMLIPQSGCGGATPACDVDEDGNTSCRAVTVMGTSNNHCTTDTACKAGYTCVGDGVTGNTPWCSRFCAADTDCLGNGSRCLVDLTNTVGDPINVKVCTNACDPYAQTGCPSGMGCIARNMTGGDFTDCRYMGTKIEGQACTASSECKIGTDCITQGGVKTCRKFCIVGNAASCTSPKVCTGFADPVMIGTVQYGVCL